MASYHYWQLPEFASRTGQDCLELKTAHSLPSPGKGEVLVRVHAISLNFRDLMISKNIYPLLVQKTPLIPASDGAGEIVQVGQGVTNFNKSDRIAANFSLQHLKGSFPTFEETTTALGGAVDGMMTQYKVLPAESIVHIPSHLTYQEAATLPCAALTAWNALFGSRDNPVLPGATVVAIGTGGVSLFCAQFAIAAGAKVLITSSSDDKLAKVKALFTKEQLERLYTVNYKTTPDWDNEVRKVCGPKGVSHVLEVGGAGTLSKSHSCIKRGGVIANIGFVAQGEIPNVQLLNVLSGSTFRSIVVGSAEQFLEMNTCIEVFKIKPHIDRVFELKEAPSAYEYLWSQQHVGKVVVNML